ncbi:FeoA family protein [Aquabacterium sp. OR-4]|uniref:FeoA family protein n=1 Tax=Aquabacterium sp. OR-4 TaxID=2978127 RepID=UPI0021B2A1D6|nr:FeoA family protein [Aquabacterium sp. OR-4]MDT7836173.1 FeoA family protein [Aquabacterium sp. OR-4]
MSRTAPAATLADLPDGRAATVHGVDDEGGTLDTLQLRRLRELGFLPGEPVKVLRRGPGGREPLAVQVGDTLFALRLAEARCVLVD